MSEPSTIASIPSLEPAQAPANASTATVQAVPMPTAEALPENIGEHIAADDDDNESAYGSSVPSDTTSVTSSIYRGYFENGRRYQNLKQEGYITPADEQQFEVLQAGHVYCKVLDSQEDNPLFRSLLGEKAHNVLDIGTGDASWAIDVADSFPNLSVRGVDLYPPSHTNVPPNLTLEVDDVTKPWVWTEKFDLIHLRFMMGSFTIDEWAELYKQAYHNLAPGGWIEQIEVSGDRHCDDDTMPVDSLLTSQGDLLRECGEAAGRPLTTYFTMKDSIKAAGFVNIQEKTYKAPIGAWPQHRVYKDAGRIGMDMFRSGMEGWMMYLLTKFGPPTPWSPEEVQVYLAKIRRELDSKWHIYQKAKRVWAQKPYDAPKDEEQVEIQKLASDSESEKPKVKKQKVSLISLPCESAE